MDHAVSSTTAYSRDAKYYLPDDSGVFLVDNTLFKLHATQVFGPRPVLVPKLKKGIVPTYIEDIIPRLPDSSDGTPIVLPYITAKQFRNYLLAITCRPGDENYSKLDRYGYIMCHGEQLQDLYTLYVDIATPAQLFGMIKLEDWAIDKLHFMLKGSSETVKELISLAEKWSASTLLELRTLSRNTKLERPVLSFIQRLVSLNLHDATRSDFLGSYTSVDIFNIIKASDYQSTQVGVSASNSVSFIDRLQSLMGYPTSNDSAPFPNPLILSEPGDDSVLLGYIFLNVLSLGHRSRIWSGRINRKDKAILYAAQVQFVDALTEFQTLKKWVVPDPPREITSLSTLCPECKDIIINSWKSFFGEFCQKMGSGLPLKDVSLLSQIADFHRKSEEEWENKTRGCMNFLTAKSLSFKLCTPEEPLKFLDLNMQKFYEEVAFRYKMLAEYK
ncbi:hypothetical protein RHS04_07607 [Rhizoctonia solani]|uniref:Uncharacterized protein n=1 Tax=Rhizoctonia solani TaxID=456999 RepID=A0A8H7LHD5_9AGAM|nr:hypothetical protein RHS04_07607 [Rhizoctonia solani]